MSTDKHPQELTGDEPDRLQNDTDQTADEPPTRLQGGLLASDASPGGLLGAILGGAAGGGTEEPVGLGGLLGAILGSGTAEPASSGELLEGLGGIITPLIKRLMENLDLQPEIAQAAVAFVLEKLRGARRGEVAPGETSEMAAPEMARGTDLGEMITRLHSGQELDEEELHSSGLTSELAARAGLDKDTAAQALLQLLAILAGKEPSKPRKKRKTTKSTAKKRPAKKSTARKPAAKKTGAEKPSAKKSTARKPAAKKSTARKPAAKKTPTKKSK